MVVENYDTPLTIVGGGEFSNTVFQKCLKIAPNFIAVDSGLNFLDINKNIPDWIIGDLDSAKNLEDWRHKGSNIKKIEEQNTTDFEKCLYSFNAPFFLANAFLGKRIDHTLAAISTIVKMKNKRVILVGNKDILFHFDNSLELNLEVGTRLSLFPLKDVVGVSSEGLKYNIENIQFSPGYNIGTSNQVSQTKISIKVDGSGMVLILPLKCLKNILEYFSNYILSK